MLVSNENTAYRQDWNIDQLCEASSLIYPVLPPLDSWACTPTFYDVPSLLFKTKEKTPNYNYYVFMEAHQEGKPIRFQEGIYRHFSDIKRQVLVDDMKKNGVFTKGFHTLDKACEFWKERCPQVLHSASYTKSLLVLKELLVLHPSLGSKAQEIITGFNYPSAPPEQPTASGLSTSRTTRFIRPRDSPLSPSSSTAHIKTSSKRLKGIPLPFPDLTFSLYVVNGDDSSIVEHFDGLRDAFFAALEARGRIAMFLAADEEDAVQQWVNVRGGDGDVYETSYCG